MPLRTILSLGALGNVTRKQAMRLLFGGRYAKLETMNRILTDAARKRTERIEELEAQVGHLKQELETARKRARALEVELAVMRQAATQRADLLNEKDKELAVVREAATEYVLRIRELERALSGRP